MVTSGQPSLNPRLVKEADSLFEAGFDVTVIYLYWNDWGTDLDKQLLAGKKWRSIRVGGNPKNNKWVYWLSRIRHKLANSLVAKFGYRFGLAELSIARGSLDLTRKAKSLTADLYIAHNLGALPATVLAAKANHAKCGFDAEDFHRQEATNDENSRDFKLKKIIEDKYLPTVDYLTASSPMISQIYKKLYPAIYPKTILNVFPAESVPKSPIQDNKLKLFWFSQTIGLNRGLEIVIAAMGLLKDFSIELHLLGAHDENTIQTFTEIAAKENVNSYQIQFYKPIAPNDIFAFAAQFDIGLATEISIPRNRDICLTNKIFTYIQSELAIIASATSAQQDLLKSYPNMGKLFRNNDTQALANAIASYAKDRELLHAHQLQAVHYAQQELNWEKESLKFINQVKQVIAK